jgi:hypothetical protein
MDSELVFFTRRDLFFDVGHAAPPDLEIASPLVGTLKFGELAVRNQLMATIGPADIRLAANDGSDEEIGSGFLGINRGRLIGSHWLSFGDFGHCGCHRLALHEHNNTERWVLCQEKSEIA